MEFNVSKAKEPEQTRKLFIGGLDYTATNDSLRKMFEQWGEIVDVVVVKDPITKRSRGFGFVTYSQSSMVDRAMSNRPHKINDREVETKRAVSREDIEKANIRTTVKKIYVSGIKKQSTNNLNKYFKKFGNIMNIKIITAKDSGKRKGYGFIEYDDTDSVDKAIFIKSHIVAGRKLHVKKAIRRAAVAGYSRGRRSGYSGGDGGGVNGSSWRVNPRFGKWSGYYNKSNGWVGVNGNCGIRGKYGEVGYEGRACVYNSNSGRACQSAHKKVSYVNPVWGNQRGGGWGVSQQPSNNLGINQSYSLINSYYPTNNYATPYGNSGTSYTRAGYAGNGRHPSQQLYYTP